MKNILLYSVILMFILFILKLLLYLISMKSLMDREKNSPFEWFECGFDPFESSRIPFSSNFF